MSGQTDRELVERLRAKARQASEVSRQLAEAKSLRQDDNHERRTDLYMWSKPEDTVEWQAADRIEALSNTPKGEAVPLREIVARIIAPEYWAGYDRSLRPFSENRGAGPSDDPITYQMMWTDGCRSVEDAKEWWRTTDRPVMIRQEQWRDSLKKADAILAALTSAPTAPDDQVDGLREALADGEIKTRGSSNHGCAVEIYFPGGDRHADAARLKNLLDAALDRHLALPREPTDADQRD